MAERCDTAAVLGAGVMGAGIAAHFVTGCDHDDVRAAEIGEQK